MNWFEQLTGFAETRYDETRARLGVAGDRLHSSANGASWRVGSLEMPTLAELRARSRDAQPVKSGQLHVRNLSGDVHGLHADPDARGALFQVASQFNLLEMLHYDVTPEDGVSRYASDRTQGPACAIAAGPATLYRNYFAPVGNQLGQTRERQLNALADLAAALPGGDRICMRNGYALVDRDALHTIDAALAAADEVELDQLRSLLRIGLHWDVEVTAAGPGSGQSVSQAFCSALPVSYNTHADPREWERFARLVLEASYEATLHAAVVNARRGAGSRVYLTLLGGGAFGNPRTWILPALRRALEMVSAADLEVILVSHGDIATELLALERSHALR